jgi:site-specific DNA-methyltransferase (adenine-specific)
MKFSDGMWYIPPERKRNGHPAPFPEELVYRLIKFYSYKGSNILDMFGGTGTVAVVSHKNNRNFIYIDISGEYCNTTKERLRKIKEEMTQQKINQ